MKYVVVSGGVLSGVGKGVIASSIGVLLQASGLRVTSIKIDPYLNIDAGTMSPFEHGEVYVLGDGGEGDLDLGNYERFMGTQLSWDNNITTGKVYNAVIERERRGGYLGKTVQIIPHITDEIQAWIQRVARVPVDGKPGTPDVCVIEVGGTVGDIESMPFIEALRQLEYNAGSDNVCFVHVSLVPVVGSVGEQKTKPTQQSVKELRSLGLSPAFVACRSSSPLDAGVRKKIAMFCQVPQERVLGVHDVSNVYRVPLLLEKQGFCAMLKEKLKLTTAAAPDLRAWRATAARQDSLRVESAKEVVVAAVGKYTELSDAYLSVINAVQHAALNLDVRVKIEWIEASNLEDVKTDAADAAAEKTTAAATAAAADAADADGAAPPQDAAAEHAKAWASLKAADCVLVPGGFGTRGVEGMILAAQYAREEKKPYLGVCLGMQIAVIETCRNVCGMKTASSAEFDEAAEPAAIVYMPEISKTHMGGTMRLGTRRTVFRDTEGVTARLYGGVDGVDERHRHRYEVNPTLVPEIEAKAPLRFVGQDDTGQRMEVVELPRSGEGAHPYFVGVQYHPEFLTRPMRPSPPFVGLLAAAAGALDDLLASPERLPLSFDPTSQESAPATAAPVAGAAAAGAAAAGADAPEN